MNKPKWWLRLKEWQRQSIEQPLHVAMTYYSVIWPSALIPLDAAVLFTVAWVGYREYKQWPSSRWWDPYLDWTFELVGILLAIYMYNHGVSYEHSLCNK